MFVRHTCTSQILTREIKTVGLVLALDCEIFCHSCTFTETCFYHIDFANIVICKRVNLKRYLITRYEYTSRSTGLMGNMFTRKMKMSLNVSQITFSPSLGSFMKIPFVFTIRYYHKTLNARSDHDLWNIYLLSCSCSMRMVKGKRSINFQNDNFWHRTHQTGFWPKNRITLIFSSFYDGANACLILCVLVLKL